MATLAEVVYILEQLGPPALTQAWDKSGFSYLADTDEQIVRGIVTALDLTYEVAQAAISRGYNLIVTRHPFVFLDSIATEEASYPYKRIIFDLLRRHRIHVYSLHSNYELLNAQAAREILAILCADTPHTVTRIPTLPSALGVTTALRLGEFINLIEQRLQLDQIRLLRTSRLDAQAGNILLLPGSWNITAITAHPGLLSWADTIITSDIKWSDWLAYQEMGITVLEVPHLIEQWCSQTIGAMLAQYLPDVAHYHHLMTLPYRSIGREMDISR